MLKIRIIPVLTFNGLGLVKTRQFSNPRMVGNPIQAARVYNNRGVDELIFTDIFASRQNRKMNLSFTKKVLKECQIPLGVGGGIKDLEDVRAIMQAGADKVVIKTAAFANPGLITEAAKAYGAQAITIAVDARKDADGNYSVEHFRFPSQPLENFIREMARAGAGEFFVNSIDCDGMMEGFDPELYRQVSQITSLPIIACGGAGEPAHFLELRKEVEVGAMAAASIFHFTQYTPHDIKLILHENGYPVRILKHLARS